LGNLCARYDITIGRAHSADADAGATLLLLWSMMQNYPNQFRGDLDDLQDMLAGRQQNSDRLGPSLVDLEPVDGTNGRLRHSDQGIVIAFGKHKGRTLQELQKIDERYLDWLSSPSSPISSKTVSELLRNHRE
jgi:DNA polymerase-3 subunit epsilon